MTSEQLGGDATPGEVVRLRLKEIRKKRRLNPDKAAELYGDPAMSTTVLMNIEAGRRRTPVTVDELMRFAYALDVPPEALLVPGADQQVQVAPGVVVDSTRLLRWMRGEEALNGTDTAHYEAVAAGSLGPSEGRVPQQLRDEFLTRAQAAFDGFFADSDEIRRKTRQQVREVLGEVRTAATNGVPTDELITMIDGFLDRLE
ncbi:helix-turn-helix domain-containing protein [Micromonospora sp. NBC_00330]|uniref:helix-turn-helix domain-containing protein n=1 Tax=Micromonospora sp. NBC_00330 TaxID=2903585 RepID=UPI002E2AA039|nr:helix-turn-helix transcriptional regulator [Micromonospora sp. NBC_00330]